MNSKYLVLSLNHSNYVRTYQKAAIFSLLLGCSCPAPHSGPGGGAVQGMQHEVEEIKAKPPREDTQTTDGKLEIVLIHIEWLSVNQ